MATTAAEDYLKAIYKLSSDDEPATTSAVADRLKVSAGSVTGMLKRLAERGLVKHVPYYGARLTPEGETDAVGLIRRHRIIELFLVEVLGYTWDRVHEEAERLEHTASDELIDRMARVLGEPEADPHGAPIPFADGVLDDPSYPTLAELETGTRAIVRRVSDRDSAALRYVAELGLRPGIEVRVVGREPFDGPIRLRIGGEERVIGNAMAAIIQAEPRTGMRAAVTANRPGKGDWHGG